MAWLREADALRCSPILNVHNRRSRWRLADSQQGTERILAPKSCSNRVHPSVKPMVSRVSKRTQKHREGEVPKQVAASSSSVAPWRATLCANGSRSMGTPVTILATEATRGEHCELSGLAMSRRRMLLNFCCVVLLYCTVEAPTAPCHGTSRAAVVG